MTELLEAIPDEAARRSLAERLGLEGDPADFGAWLTLGRNLAVKGRAPDAVEATRAAIAIRPQDVGAYSILGGHLLAARRLEEAVEACQRALEIKPDDQGSLRRLCSALMQLRRNAEAVPLAQRVVDGSPEEPEAFLLQAAVLQPVDADAARAARTTAAEKARAQVAADGSKLLPRIGLAKALAALNNWPEATAAAREASALKPEDAGLHNMVASFLLRAGNREEALAEARLVLAARDSKTMVVNLGDELTALRRATEALLQLKRPAEALPLARELVEKQPGDAGAKRLLDAAEAAPAEAATVAQTVPEAPRAEAAPAAAAAPATAPKGKVSKNKTAAPESGEKLDRRKLKKQEARGQSKPPKRGPR